MGTPEKLEELAQKMGELEKAVEQSTTKLDDELYTKIQTGINALILGLEKAIDGLTALVSRFFK